MVSLYDVLIWCLVHAAVAFIINRIGVFYKYEMKSILHLKILKQIKCLSKHFYLAKSWDGWREGGCRPSSPPLPPRLSLSYTFTYVLYNISCTCAYHGVSNFFEDFFGKFLCFLETSVLRFALFPYYRRFLQ